LIVTDVDTLIDNNAFVIDSLSSSETIALVLSKDELMTIKEALTETTINSSLLASQKFGLLNRQIKNYLETLE
jgi:hypothetical protein